MFFLFSLLVMLLVGCSYGVLRSGRLTRAQPDPGFEPRRLATHAAALLIARQVVLGSSQDTSKDLVVGWFQKEFTIDETEALDLWSSAMSQAMLEPGPEDGLAVLLAPIKTRCTLQEMKDLASFLGRVGSAGAPLTEGQETLVAEVRRRLSLPEEVSSSGHP
ncbi:MAG: hypothetical protein AAF511_03585 [Pseudomonadota bacterium]